MLKSARSQILTMEWVFEMWDYHMFEKVDALDHMVRHIIREMNTHGVPTYMAREYLQAQFVDMVEQCAEKTMMGRGKSAGRGISA